LLYCPATHAMHVAPELLVSVLVTAPVGHDVHATIDTLLYCPAPHAVQLVAPTKLSRLVTEPAQHTKQLVCPELP